MSSQTQESPSVRLSGDRILLSNRWIELGFSRGSKGALVSIVHRPTGCELRRDQEAPAPLFRLSLRRPQNPELEWIDSGQAENFDWRVEDTEDARVLTLILSGFRRRAAAATSPHVGLEVSVSVRLVRDSALSIWNMSVRQLDRDTALHQLTCPVVSGLAKVGEPAPGEALAVPIHGEGYLFKNPFPVRDRLPLCSGAGPEAADVGVGRVRGRYPGSLSLQMYAFYNDEAGLYFAAHDAGQHVKELEMGPWPSCGPSPVLALSHFPGESPGQEVRIAYDCIVGVFRGDWFDAARLYKDWAVRQWWCERKLWDRDIPEWLRRGIGGVFQMSNYHIPKLDLNHSMAQIADTVNALSREAGVPLLGLVFNWERGGAWTGPDGFFPPREGEGAFRNAMARLKEAGNLGFVYITGGCWYLRNTYDPPFDSWTRFDREARPHATRQADGEIAVGRWYPGWECTRLCPQSEYTKELTTSLFRQCLGLGCTVVQIDNFPCSGADACYDPSHGHAAGFGPWWSVAWGRILSEVRRQAKSRNPDCALTTEGICENFIPWVDLYDHRAGNMEYFGHYHRGLPMGGETIPLFNAVYHEYIGCYTAAYPESNRPEVLYWTRCLGKSLVQGALPTGGRYFPDPPHHNPVTIGFYRKIVRAAGRECWPYLMFGEMLRPPEIDVPEIVAQYCKFNYDPERKEHRMDPCQRHEVRDRAVQHGLFRGRDGSLAYLFVNVSEQDVRFDVVLSSQGAEMERFDVDAIVDGQCGARAAGVPLPRVETLAMQPLSVTVIVVRKASGAVTGIRVS
ncbi:MAG: hypothetical protein HYU36_24690 [Planctomycetes bacterium]|nr:hypothetical protein [Planctomycetota bacterium]